MGFYAGYGIAVISYVQMAVICYTGQNVVDRVNLIVQNHIIFYGEIASVSDLVTMKSEFGFRVGQSEFIFVIPDFFFFFFWIYQHEPD